VQQINDRSYFRQSNLWIDGRLLKDIPVTKYDEQVEFGSDRYEELLTRFIAEGRQGCLSLRGDILMSIDGKRILIHGLGAEPQSVHGEIQSIQRIDPLVIPPLQNANPASQIPRR